MGASVAIVGAEVIKTVFKNNEDPVGKIISIGPGKYQRHRRAEGKGLQHGFQRRPKRIPATKQCQDTIFPVPTCRSTSI